MTSSEQNGNEEQEEEQGRAMQNKSRFGFNRLLSVIASVAGLIYLAAIPLNLVSTANRFTTTEAALLLILLLFNSGLIDKLQELTLSKEGLVIKTATEVAEKVAAEKVAPVGHHVDSIQKNVEAQNEVIQRITPVEAAVENISPASREQETRLVIQLLSSKEWEHLQKLARNEPFPYVKRASFDGELRRLRTLGFIENQGRPIADLPREGNLRDFIQITERGQSYYKMRMQLE